jgi:GNAT superfamily N-acetyltransferase
MPLNPDGITGYTSTNNAHVEWALHTDENEKNIINIDDIRVIKGEQGAGHGSYALRRAEEEVESIWPDLHAITLMIIPYEINGYGEEEMLSRDDPRYDQTLKFYRKNGYKVSEIPSTDIPRYVGMKLISRGLLGLWSKLNPF